MVLEGAAASSDAHFSDEQTPSSDVDRYADGNPDYSATRPPSYILVSPPPNRVYVNLSALPRPLGIFTDVPFPPAFVSRLQSHCQSASQVLRRPLTQDEADALGFHFARGNRIASFGQSVGLTLGCVQLVRTGRQFRFPFGWSPAKEGGRYSPDRFWSLRGPQARVMWHGLRGGAYSLTGSTIGLLFFGIYAANTTLVKELLDPRLRDYSQAVRDQQTAGRRQAASAETPTQDQSSTTQPETFEQRRQRRSLQDMTRRNQATEQGRYRDDASPTGGEFESEFLDTATGPGSWGNEDMKDQAPRAQSETRSNPAESTTQQSRPREQISDFGIPERDARTDSQADKPSGSVWDRLRQQALQSGGGSGSRDSAPRGKNDDASFSSADRNRQLAKSEAQRDFDKRIEQEREGKDFDERSTDRRRW